MDNVEQLGPQGEQRRESLGRTALWVLVSGVCYYIATKIAWELCFPDSKVSLLFPPHAVLVSVLLLVPVRHWWIYTLSALGGHLLATQQAHWPFLYALHCEAFDAVQNLAVAAGIRIFIKSPLQFVTLRDAIVFVLIAVIVVPFGTAFWGAAFTLSNKFGTDYWLEWRNLGISNGVTAVVLVPAILLGVHYLSARRMKKITAGRLIEAGLLGVGILMVGTLAFDKLPAGPGSSPALLYAPIPLLIWAALRFGLGGMSASMLVITFQAIWGAMNGRGPFLMQSPAENVLALQTFLLVTATPLMFLAVVIEEERRTQYALRESEVRFRGLADTAPVMIWMSGTDKLCIFFNQGWLDFTGRSLELELGNGWATGVHREDIERCLDTYGRSFDARQAFTMEYRLRRHDGEYRWVLDSGTPRLADDGAFLGYVGSCLDITERKRAEDRFRFVLDAAPNAMIMVDSDGLISFANSPAATLFGYSEQELIGRNIETLIPQRFRGGHSDHRKTFLSHPSSRTMGAGRDLFGRRKDGSEFPVEVGLNPVRRAEGMFVLASVTDMTARKQAELEHQRQNMELARVGRVAVMGELAASLAHEVNNPIGAMVTNASAGQRLIATGEIEIKELDELFADIVADGRRAGEIIQGIRAMVRKGNERRSLIQINDTINDLLRIVHAEALGRDVKLEVDLDPVGGRVMADRVHILQVLLNLTMNGFEAMSVIRPNKRRLVIRAAGNESGQICISVRDSGPGFPQGMAEQFFEPFFSTKAEGTGMGLAIARGIVEAHGGSLSGENCEDGGGRFTICLPEATEDRSEKLEDRNSKPEVTPT